MYCEIQFRMIDLINLWGLDESSCCDKLEGLVYKEAEDLFFNSSNSNCFIGMITFYGERGSLDLLIDLKSRFSFLDEIPVKYNLEQDGFWDQRK